MIENLGEMDIESANDSNVPVNIFLGNENGDGDKDGKFYLTADNFMPRKMRADGSAFRYSADTREELQELVRKHILPLYQVALQNVTRMADGTGDKHYYWELAK